MLINLHTLNLLQNDKITDISMLTNLHNILVN
jgi:hypothetical protein